MHSDKIKILLADEDPVNRFLLKTKLAQQGHAVTEVETGQDAVNRFHNLRPDLVILDFTLPGMSGCQAARKIKQSSADTFVPILFLTSLDDEDALTICLDAGGDDFIHKTASPALLNAKISALMRVKDLYLSQQQKNQELLLLNEERLQELQMAERVFQNIVHKGSLEQPNIRYSLNPLSTFNGDILLAARPPGGGLNVLLGDFTGHGLAAAIGAIPTANAFYAMTQKGFSIGYIGRELNRKLKAILPVDKFLAAGMMSFNPDFSSMAVWSGGINNILVYGKQCVIKHRVVSRCVPLGIVDDECFHSGLDFFELEQGDRVFAFTDGLPDACNRDGRMFGLQTIENILTSAQSGDDCCDLIMRQLRSHMGDACQQDDISMVEIIADATLADPSAKQEFTTARCPASWKIDYHLEADSLRLTDFVPLVIHDLLHIQGLGNYREKLYTIFTELFSNALDHGVLELSSEMKKTPDGFVEFYQERTERLKNLKQGWIKVFLKHVPLPENLGGELSIVIEDSGAGFDYEKVMQAIAHSGPNEHNFGGRGLLLASNLCEKLEFSGPGNRVKAIFQWS